jgi:hypothetical protein
VGCVKRSALRQGLLISQIETTVALNLLTKDYMPGPAQSYICEKDGKEFPTLEAYKAHKVDHQLGKINDKGELLAPPVAPNSAPVPVKATDAPWRTALEDHKKAGVALIYKYTGYCNKCGGAVETIQLDNVVKGRKEWIIVAWCGTCKVKISQRAVAVL